MNRPELLLPAGSPEKLAFALAYGADAVYLAGRGHSLRASDTNFNIEELSAGIMLAHSRGVKVYVTLNSFPHNSHFPDLSEAVSEIAALQLHSRPDGVIVADPGVFSLVAETTDLPLHVSTQANTLNVRAAQFWERLGAKRIVLAREATLTDIAEIRQAVSCELEVFIHGAMCISYSGRCLLSSFMSGKDSNRGECTQSCRWKYSLMEEKRPGQYYPIGEDESNGSYILNSRDLCMVEHIPELINSGIDSFKVEGRMKSVYYVAVVGRAYRMVIDSVMPMMSSGESELPREPQPHILAEAMRELESTSHRPFYTGFFFGNPGPNGQFPSSSRYSQTHEIVGDVLEYFDGRAKIKVRNRLIAGQVVEVISPCLPGFCQRISDMIDVREDYPPTLLGAAHANYVVEMAVDSPVEPMSILRRLMTDTDRDR